MSIDEDVEGAISLYVGRLQIENVCLALTVDRLKDEIASKDSQNCRAVSRN